MIKTNSFPALACAGFLCAVAGCGSEVVSPITTGSGGSSSGSAGVASGGGGPTDATTLANSGPGSVQSIAVDATDVYWTTRTALWKVAKDGGTLTPITTGAMGYWSVIADSTNVYWLEEGGATPGLHKMPAGGSTSTVLDPVVDSRSIAVDATSVYWASYDGTNASIMKVPIGGGTPTTLATGLRIPQFVTVDTVNVYWNDMQANTINSVPIAGGIVGTLDADEGTTVMSIAARKGWVYWATMVSPGGIAEVPAGGGSLKVFATTKGAEYFAIDDYDVYWTDGLGGIERMQIGGGTVSTVVYFGILSNGNASCIAVDDTDVYWGGMIDGSIQKAPKAP